MERRFSETSVDLVNCRCSAYPVDCRNDFVSYAERVSEMLSYIGDVTNKERDTVMKNSEAKDSIMTV